MSTSIDQAFVKQFEREVHEAYQRQGSKLRGTVRVKTGVVGGATVFQRVGTAAAQTKGRHAMVPVTGLEHSAVEVPLVDFYRLLNDRVRALPGVQSAGFVRVLPLATTIGDFGLDVDGYEEGPGRNAKGDWQIVTDGAFEALGTRLLRGRWFAPLDTIDSHPVAVINETLARTYWTNPEDAVGGRIRVGNSRNPWVTVIGMVADERHNGVTGIVKEKFFVPHSQWHVVTGGNIVRNVFVVVRTTGDPLSLAGPVRSQIRAMDASLPVANIRTMADVVATALATPRLTGFFGRWRSGQIRL